MATEYTTNDPSIVAFLQALAVTVWNFDRLTPAEKQKKSFVLLFDGYLNEAVKHAEADGEEIEMPVNNLRSALEIALRQMEFVKMPYGPMQ